jgi:hypothetical protein
MSKKNFKKPAGARDLADKKEEARLNKEEIDRSAKSYWEKKYDKSKEELLFGKQHFIILGAGLAILIIGFFLMSGGAMTDENTWDPGTIYSFTRITLAPILVLSGLAIVGYAIFYNSPSDKNALEKLSENTSEEE